MSVVDLVGGTLPVQARCDRQGAPVGPMSVVNLVDGTPPAQARCDRQGAPVGPKRVVNLVGATPPAQASIAGGQHPCLCAQRWARQAASAEAK